MSLKKFFLIITSVIAVSILPSASYADIYLRNDKSATQETKEQSQPAQTDEEKAPTPIGVIHAREIAKNCLEDQWESPPCLQAISNNNLVMLSNFGATLQEAGKTRAAEDVKQKCAASTAAARKTFPAKAMRSAFVECANFIPIIAGQTSLAPDQSLFQLMAISIQCLDKAPVCSHIERGLKSYNP